MVQMPTGTGKTVLLAEVIKCEERKANLENSAVKVLVVAHRRELIEQIRMTLERFGIEREEEKKEEAGNGSVWVESVQKLAKEDKSLSVFQPHLVIIDEAHHALAKTYRTLWDRWPQAKFLGLTATPCRLNGRGFTDLFDVLLQAPSIQTFIKQGWLSNFEYVSARPDSATLRKVRLLKKRGADGDYQTKEMVTVMDVPESIAHLHETYKQFANGKKGIVYAIDRQHAAHIAEHYQKQGVSCCLIDSQTPVRERERLVKEYQDGRMSVLVNVDIFGEGFDCPEVEFIQLARPTLSLSKYLQQVGRGMRVSRGKPHVLIIDNVGLYQTFGLPTEERDWKAMFLGKEAGKGDMHLSRYVVIDEEAEAADSRQRELVNLEMVRIKSGGQKHSGLEVFLKEGLYGVMQNGRVTCPARFKRIERLEKSCGFFALGTYMKPNRHEQGRLMDVTTVIDNRGHDMNITLYGHVRWNGDYFIGQTLVGNRYGVSCWDPVGKSYYEDIEPEFQTVGGVEVALAHEHDNWYAYCLKLRCSTGKVSPRFDLQEMFYNRWILIARNYLVVKNDHNHAYKICGYLNDTVLVQNENSYGYQQFFPNGKKGAFFPRMPQGSTPVLVPSRLKLQRVEKN